MKFFARRVGYRYIHTSFIMNIIDTTRVDGKRNENDGHSGKQMLKQLIHRYKGFGVLGRDSYLMLQEVLSVQSFSS